jgi:hypothetical protein
LIAQSPKGVLNQLGQLINRARNCLVQGCCLVSESNGLTAFEARFHYAAFVVLPVLVAAFITQVDLHSRDIVADSVQNALNCTSDLVDQRLVSFDVTVCVELDLRRFLLL